MAILSPIMSFENMASAILMYAWESNVNNRASVRSICLIHFVGWQCARRIITHSSTTRDTMRQSLIGPPTKRLYGKNLNMSGQLPRGNITDMSFAIHLSIWMRWEIMAIRQHEIYVWLLCFPICCQRMICWAASINILAPLRLRELVG